MASQRMSFYVRGVGGGRGPTVRPSAPVKHPHAIVLQTYADMLAKKKKKKGDDNDLWKT